MSNIMYVVTRSEPDGRGGEVTCNLQGFLIWKDAMDFVKESRAKLDAYDVYVDIEIDEVTYE